MKAPPPKGAKTLFTFDVLYAGWECDSVGKVCEFKGKRFLVLTSHGTPYVAEPKELHDRISEYRKAIENTEKALAMAPSEHLR